MKFNVLHFSGNKFSFSFPSPKQAKASPSHIVNDCILPRVQGVSVKKNKKIRHESTEEVSVPSAQPPPTPIVASSVNLINDRPKVETISVEKLISDTITVRKVPSVKEQSSGKENSVEDGSLVGKVTNEKEAAPPVSSEATALVEKSIGATMPPEAKKQDTKPKKILVDRSVNVPSIPGDMSHLDEFTLTPRPRAIRQQMFGLDDKVKVKAESVDDNTPQKEESEIEIGSATDGLSMEAKGDSSLFMSDKMRELTGVETPLEENMEEGSVKDSSSNKSENDEKKRIFITEDQNISDEAKSKEQNELSEKSNTNGCDVIDERMSTDSDTGSTVHVTNMTEANAEFNITVDVQIATNETIPAVVDDECHFDNISLGSVNKKGSS